MTDPVLVMLADNIVEHTFAATVESFLEQGRGARIILTEPEDPTHLKHLGVPELDATGRIVRIVEKPEIPPSVTR